MKRPKVLLVLVVVAFGFVLCYTLVLFLRRPTASLLPPHLPTVSTPPILPLKNLHPESRPPVPILLPSRPSPKPWHEIASQDVARGGGCWYPVRWKTSINEIFEGLYLGEQTAAASFDILNHFGIDVVFNLAPNSADNYFENDETFEYHAYAIRDKATQDISDILDEIADLIHEAIDVNGKTVFVHCSCGVSRSTSMVVAYMMKYRDFGTFESAYQFVKSKRVVARPNDNFRLQLTKWGRTLQV